MKKLENWNLLPCPCCRSTADFLESRKDGRWKVLCGRCGMRTAFLSSKSQARKTWNRRYISSPIINGITALTKHDVIKNLVGKEFTLKVEPSGKAGSTMEWVHLYVYYKGKRVGKVDTFEIQGEIE